MVNTGNYLPRPSRQPVDNIVSCRGATASSDVEGYLPLSCHLIHGMQLSVKRLFRLLKQSFNAIVASPAISNIYASTVPYCGGPSKIAIGRPPPLFSSGYFQLIRYGRPPPHHRERPNLCSSDTNCFMKQIHYN